MDEASAVWKETQSASGPKHRFSGRPVTLTEDGTMTFWIFRGSSWDFDPFLARSAYSNAYTSDSPHWIWLGFRLARTPGQRMAL